MRKLLIASAVVTGVGFCTGAFAADYASYSPKTTAYLNFGFGGNAKNSSVLSSLHYGLRMDQRAASAFSAVGQPVRPAFMQADFNLRDGFSGAMVNGVRFASHVKKFDEDGGDTSYSVVDWGLLAIGAAGLGFGISEVLKTKDSKDPTSTGATGGTGGNPVIGAVCSLAGGVLGTIGLGGICTASGLAGNSFSAYEKADYESINWLDSGTGQMGDLRTIR